jgi:riboflavin kinase / FMN adenylyltransferase
MIATIGVFDGVHRGHAALLRIVLERARETGDEAMVATFEPHPISVLAPEVRAHRLASRSVKLRYFAELGIGRVWEIPFSRDLAALTPGEFLENLLLREAPVRELWVGYDFRFGRGREGEITFLRREGKRLGFEVQQFGPVHQGGRVLSSTWVREALARGDLEEAREVLGHDFILEERVIRGLGLGARQLVATANLEFPPEQILPAFGVYAAWAEYRGDHLPAVVSIGVRPTIFETGIASGPRPVSPLVEAHLIDWQGDLRDQPLTLHLGTRLRGELTFPDLASLRKAIAEDIQMAKGWLVTHAPSPPLAGYGG